MPRPPIDLAAARVLLANDDGIQAPGLRLLERILRKEAREVWVVAPETEQSAASHSLTMRRPLYVRKVGRRRYTVDGTPTDCILLAIHQVMKRNPPDVVISGINRGGNMGEDATYSGTVAAAREGTMLGFPSVALSQLYEDGSPVHWETAERWTPEVLRRLLQASWPPAVLINVNFPAVPAAEVRGIEITNLGRRKIGGSMVAGEDPRGERYFWIGGGRREDRGREGTDLEAVHRGAVSISPVSLELTHEPTVAALKDAFA
ncbi:MAG TPA: 5'/3'-nucleotidase SurE [Rhodospirillales bacterium]|nr:5'/3'-nucleotidase SurE [Rhodospirillales bacterium]